MCSSKTDYRCFEVARPLNCSNKSFISVIICRGYGNLIAWRRCGFSSFNQRTSG